MELCEKLKRKPGLNESVIPKRNREKKNPEKFQQIMQREMNRVHCIRNCDLQSIINYA